jgi:hypothetical protein
LAIIGPQSLRAKDSRLGYIPHRANILHPRTNGAMMIGLEIDERIEFAVQRLTEKGVHLTGSIVRAEAGAWAGLEDPDGNAIYLWEVNRTIVPKSELEVAAQRG